jgi:hypothetical protein
MHPCLAAVMLGMMILPGEHRVQPSPSDQPGVVAIDLCSQDSSFTILGKKTRVAADARLPGPLAQAARAASSAGMRSVIIKSACKLTTVALANYCEAFEAEQVRVIRVMVPVASPSARKTLHCGDKAF